MLYFTSTGWPYNVHVLNGARWWAGAVLWPWLESWWHGRQHSDSYEFPISTKLTFIFIHCMKCLEIRGMYMLFHNSLTSFWRIMVNVFGNTPIRSFRNCVITNLRVYTGISLNSKDKNYHLDNALYTYDVENKLLATDCLRTLQAT